MINIVLNGIFWVLALYGLFEIIKTVTYTLICTDLKSDGIYLIIATKNQEDKIEGFLRSFLFKFFYEKDIQFKNIIVADLDSKDKTMDIISKLHKDYKDIIPTNWRECKNMIDNINEI